MQPARDSRRLRERETRRGLLSLAVRCVHVSNVGTRTARAHPNGKKGHVRSALASRYAFVGLASRFNRVFVTFATSGFLIAFPAHAAGPVTPVVLREARATLQDGTSQVVALPHVLSAPNDGLVRAAYRFDADLGAQPRGLSLYFPSLGAHSQVRINGHLLADDLGTQDMRQPLGLFKVRLMHIPDSGPPA